jgi:hypothetical protein
VSLPTVPDITWRGDNPPTVHANAWSNVVCPYCAAIMKAFRLKWHVRSCPVVMKLGRGENAKLGLKYHLAELRELLSKQLNDAAGAKADHGCLERIAKEINEIIVSDPRWKPGDKEVQTL